FPDRLRFDGGQLARLAVLNVLDHMRAENAAVVGKDRRGKRKLHRRGEVVALADANRDGVADEPLLLEAALLPVLRGQQPVDFAFDVDTGFAAQAELADEIVDGVDAEVVGQTVEIGIAGLDYRLVHVDQAVTARLPVAVGAAPGWEPEITRIAD